MIHYVVLHSMNLKNWSIMDESLCLLKVTMTMAITKGGVIPLKTLRPVLFVDDQTPTLRYLWARIYDTLSLISGVNNKSSVNIGTSLKSWQTVYDKRFKEEFGEVLDALPDGGLAYLSIRVSCEPPASLLSFPALRNLQKLRIIDDLSIFCQITFQRMTEIIQSLTINGIRLQSLVLHLGLMMMDVGGEPFQAALLDYIQTTSRDTLTTFKYNNALNDDVNKYLMQSPECKITNLSLMFDRFSRPPAITRPLIKFTYDESHPQVETIDIEFVKSFNQVRHFRQHPMMEMLFHHDFESQSISADLFNLINNNHFDTLCSWFSKNTTIQYLYNLTDKNKEIIVDQDKFDQFNQLVIQHPSLVNKSTWHWIVYVRNTDFANDDWD
ncbi:hypothetical protein SAMD00019534_051860 [Acytostelium subglobosum LB1]|uniref:hypothetical protein n=1 Tax=Acytostelium subglobosum LB1 TaxID=1410327 RepID=UPI00064519B0|nr:hypothetical protein SAMD00019534_051860 [Acytostelium subglobosum LB1]GAM22011.1 hypothetical protein SAMD00019534_051860 [Acytostelium subglobosum LB1]|eukprot:XP_012755111.1 hypothetical protein SAMD00019534_051860 [Acytostelium subglobosum LB1]